jgi:DnaJ-class molecular chaperone
MTKFKIWWFGPVRLGLAFVHVGSSYEAMTGPGGKELDLYALLGVPNSAKASDIAAAYYVLARKYHPDTGQADAESLARFKRISHAYEILSDREKRREYDRSLRRAAGVSVRQAYGDQVPVAFGRKPIYDAPRRPGGAPATGSADIHVAFPVRPEEAWGGGSCDFFLNLRQACDPCGGRGWVGGNRCGNCQGQGAVSERRRIQIRLPSGLHTGFVLRVPGQGAHRSGTCGDLLLHIRVQPYW